MFQGESRVNPAVEAPGMTLVVSMSSIGTMKNNASHSTPGKAGSRAEAGAPRQGAEDAAAQAAHASSSRRESSAATHRDGSPRSRDRASQLAVYGALP